MLQIRLQVFDKHNRGYISASDLRAVLQCLGEDLSEEESKYKIKILIGVLYNIIIKIDTNNEYII